MWMLLLYFVLGFLLDVLGTLDVQAVIDRHPIKSFFYSTTITLVSVLIIAGIVLSPERIWLTIAYALGGGIGSALTVMRKRR